MKIKNVMILYASIGGGHFKAGESIKNHILKNDPEAHVEMIDALKYVNKVWDKIILEAYLNMVKYSPKIWGEIYKISEKQYSIANFSSAVQKLLSKKLLKLLEDKQPDTIISTHPFITEMVASLKKHKKISTELNVIITDYATHKFWEIKHEYVNRYFVACEDVKLTLISHGIDKDKIFVTGIPLSDAFLKKYDKEKIDEEFHLNPQKKTILFFCGGEIGFSSVKKYLIELLKVEEDFQLITICGKNNKLKRILEKTVAKFDKDVIILGYTHKVAELMSISDFIISKPGGLTSTEIFSLQIPYIIINPIPGQEEENAKFFLNAGVSVRIYDVQKTKTMMEQLLKGSARINSMKEMQKILAKPNATNEIVKIIMKK